MDIDLWADQAVRAMLLRVRSVIAWEYEQRARRG